VLFSEIPEDHPDFHFYEFYRKIIKGKTDCIAFFSQEELQTQLRKYLEIYFTVRNPTSYHEDGCDEHDADVIAEEFAEEFMNER
jgi:hypothetical protein